MQKFSESNYAVIEKVAKKICSDDQKFLRLVLTKEQALEMFKANPFKVATIMGKIQDGKSVTAYKCGDLIDLCTGPHIPTTKIIKGFKVMRNSASNWLGKVTNDSLQRIYAISFPSQKELDEYIHFREEAEKRDHRIIGRQQNLFHHFEVSPGCAFFFPYGTKIYNKLTEMIREQYRVRGFQEVLSPNIFNLKLWKQSGHYQNYKDNLFLFKSEEQGFGLKPMNCPAHALMYDHGIHSYRDLPIRYADFGVLHRNEISGALCGLIRVRRFQQDDAHIFCTPEQIRQEVQSSLDFLEHIYGIFGFTYELQLSTRPENRLGTEEQWDLAESQLEAALNAFGKPWTYNVGDGAFYGPKIDIQVYDALKRKNQCGTIQVDFQQPIRFNLQYQHENAAQEQQEYAANKDKMPKQKLESQVFEPDEHDQQHYTWHEMPLKPGFRRPVMVHRAILGSVERFTAILCEHLAGKWPFWLSPRQAIVVPISDKALDYCESVYLYLHKLGYECELDRSSGQLNKKVRNAQLAQWNYVLVAGEQEMGEGLVDVRARDGARLGKLRVDAVAAMFAAESPVPAHAFNSFYAKAFDPAKFFGEEEAPAQGQGQGKPAAAAKKPKGPSGEDKLAAIEQKLQQGACQWLGGGNQPSGEDAAAFNDVKALKIDPRVYPHSAFWYSMVSKFSDAKRASWPGAQPAPAAAKEESKQPAAKQANAGGAKGAAKGKGKEQQPAGAKGKGKGQQAAAAQKEVSDIGMMDLRVGKIVEVWKHEESDKLYCEKIDIGNGEIRSIASGLQQFVTLEQMQGALVVVICNLRQKKLAGYPSHGMVLCAETPDKSAVELIRPPEGSEAGDLITLEGQERDPPAALHKDDKKNPWFRVAPDLNIDGEGVARWKDCAFTTPKGICKADTIRNGVIH